MKSKPHRKVEISPPLADPLLSDDETFRKGRTEYAKALEKAWDHYLKFVDLMISSAMGSALLFLASIKFVDWSQLPGKGFVPLSIACGLVSFLCFAMWRFASQHYLELQLLHPQYVTFEMRDQPRPVNAPNVSWVEYLGVEKVAWGPRLHKTRYWRYVLRPVLWFCWRPAPIIGTIGLVAAWSFALGGLFFKSPSWLSFPY